MFCVSCILVCVCFFFLSDFDFCTLTRDQIDNWTQEGEVQHRWHFSSKKQKSHFLCISSKYLQYFNFSSWTYFLWLWLRKVVLRCGQTMLLESIQIHSLNLLNFDCLCCYFKCWKSTRGCQISDSRTTRSGSYFVPHSFRGIDKKLSSRKFSFILQKTKCHLWFQVRENTNLVMIFLKTL